VTSHHEFSGRRKKRLNEGCGIETGVSIPPSASALDQALLSLAKFLSKPKTPGF